MRRVRPLLDALQAPEGVRGHEGGASGAGGPRLGAEGRLIPDWTYGQLKKSLESEFGDPLSSHEEEADFSPFESCADDPVGFIHEVLAGEPWEGQVRIAEAVQEHSQISVRRCHTAGKDWLAARLALWWTYARRGLVVLTGRTATQVQEILMRGKVRDAFVRADLSGDFHVNALRPGSEGRAGILAKTATGVSALRGFQEARVLFVISDAQAPEIDHAWDAAFAVTTAATPSGKMQLKSRRDMEGRLGRSPDHGDAVV